MNKLELKGGVEVPVETTSAAWSWPGAREWIQGAISAAIGSVLGILLPIVESGELVFDWKIVFGAALSGLITYIVRKLPQEKKIIVDPKELQQAKK